MFYTLILFFLGDFEMKKVCCLGFMMLVLLSACGDEVNKMVQTENVVYHLDDKYATVDFFVEYPIKAQNKELLLQLQQAVNAPFAQENKNQSSKIDMQQTLENAAAAFSEMAQQNLESLRKMGLNPSYKEVLKRDMRKIADTDKFVTFGLFSFVFTGGAHGNSYWWATTVDKSDGKNISAEILNQDVQKPEFKSLLKQGVFASLSTNKNHVNLSLDNLQDELLDVVKVDNLPLPEAEPFLLNDGVGFVYGAYEISYYANGNISFVIPYHLMKPYLSQKAWKMVKDLAFDKAQIRPYDLE